MTWVVEFPGGTRHGPFTESEALNYVMKQLPGSGALARCVTREEQRELTPRDPEKIRLADTYYPSAPPRAEDIEKFKAEQATKRGDPDADTALYQARTTLRSAVSKHSASAVVPRRELTMILDHLDAMDGVDSDD